MRFSSWRQHASIHCEQHRQRPTTRRDGIKTRADILVSQRLPAYWSTLSTGNPLTNQRRRRHNNTRTHRRRPRQLTTSSTNNYECQHFTTDHSHSTFYSHTRSLRPTPTPQATQLRSSVTPLRPPGSTSSPSAALPALLSRRRCCHAVFASFPRLFVASPSPSAPGFVRSPLVFLLPLGSPSCPGRSSPRSRAAGLLSSRPSLRRRLLPRSRRFLLRPRVCPLLPLAVPSLLLLLSSRSACCRSALPRLRRSSPLALVSSLLAVASFFSELKPWSAASIDCLIQTYIQGVTSHERKTSTVFYVLLPIHGLQSQRHDTTSGWPKTAAQSIWCSRLLASVVVSCPWHGCPHYGSVLRPLRIKPVPFHERLKSRSPPLGSPPRF